MNSYRVLSRTNTRNRSVKWRELLDGWPRLYPWDFHKWGRDARDVIRTDIYHAARYHGVKAEVRITDLGFVVRFVMDEDVDTGCRG